MEGAREWFPAHSFEKLSHLDKSPSFLTTEASASKRVQWPLSVKSHQREKALLTAPVCSPEEPTQAASAGWGRRTELQGYVTVSVYLDLNLRCCPCSASSSSLSSYPVKIPSFGLCLVRSGRLLDFSASGSWLSSVSCRLPEFWLLVASWALPTIKAGCLSGAFSAPPVIPDPWAAVALCDAPLGPPFPRLSTPRENPVPSLGDVYTRRRELAYTERRISLSSVLKLEPEL